MVGGVDFDPGLIALGPEAMVKACGVAMAMLPGYQLDSSLVERHMVNVGTVTQAPPWGQVHRRPMRAWRGGGPVVVRARESRAHGEGGQ
ncbi:hypothetical protein EFY87_19935 [Flexivirga caeni]|uniref:Uncharacterized protein n=1 Tax=Flexivirga caeni TaxID=2294115 RepID=A0A3M9LT66_9MICO|nr:hypothetical protein EFY87_19935 [Flexivirga caeni]